VNLFHGFFYTFYDFAGIMVRMAKFNIIFIIFIVLTIFSFWPNLIGAHYSGAISCPILSGSMAGCANIAEHINFVISSISDFKGILNFVLVFDIFAIFVFIASLFGGNFVLLPKAKKDNSSFLIKFLNLAANSAKSGNLLFLGLKRGILNTKVF